MLHANYDNLSVEQLLIKASEHESEKEYKKAFDLYQLAVEENNAEAQYKLAMMFEKGLGVHKDIKEAMRLYHLASDQGDAEAQSHLGYCYAQGMGVQKNEKEAVRLYRLAARQGNVIAKDNIKTSNWNGVSFLEFLSFKKTLPLTVASAHAFIREYSEKKVSDVFDKELFYKVMNHLQAIVSQGGWTTHKDSLQEYWLKVSDKKIDEKQDGPSLTVTQEQLIQDALEKNFNHCQYINIQTQKLYNEINRPDGIYYALFNKYIALKNKVNVALYGTLEALNSNWQEKGNKDIEKKEEILELPLDKKSELLDFYSDPDRKPFYDLCNALKGSYIPFSQSHEPLAGKQHPTKQAPYGHCYGHTIAWCNQILLKGKYLYSLRITPEVSSHQHSYQDLIPISHAYSKTLADLSICVDDLLINVTDKSIFGMTIKGKNEVYSHIVGLRKIPITEEIEFFDSNYGLFALPNIRNFKIWFTYYFAYSYPYFRPGENHLRLEVIDTQPEHACASIPKTVTSTTSFSFPRIIDKNCYKFYVDLTAFAHLSWIDKDLKIDNEIIVSQINTINNQLKIKKKDIYNLKNYTECSDILKRKICTAINDIQRISSATSSIKPLNELKEHIQKAELHMTLNAIISPWLEKNRDILDMKSLLHIKELAKKFEINPLSLTALHVNLLSKIEFILENWPPEKKIKKDGRFFQPLIPTTLRSIKLFFLEYKNEKIPPGNVLLKMAKECQKKYTNFVWNIFDGRSLKTACFYDILQAIKPSNVESILIACQALNEFIKKYAIKDKIEIKPTTSLTMRS